MKNYFLALIALFLLGTQCHAQVLRTRDQARPALSAAQLLEINSHDYSMEQLEAMGYPNGMDTIVAYNSLSRSMPKKLEMEIRTGSLENKKLQKPTVVNMWFGHLGMRTPVCLAKGIPVLINPAVDDCGSVLRQEIEYCAECCNPSNGPYDTPVKTVTHTEVHNQQSADVFLVPGDTNIVTNQHDTVTTQVMAVAGCEWNAQDVRSGETQHLAGAVSVYQVARQMTNVDKRTYNTDNRIYTNNNQKYTNVNNTDNRIYNTDNRIYSTTAVTNTCPPVTVCPVTPVTPVTPVCPVTPVAPVKPVTPVPPQGPGTPPNSGAAGQGTPNVPGQTTITTTLPASPIPPSGVNSTGGPAPMPPH